MTSARVTVRHAPRGVRESGVPDAANHTLVVTASLASQVIISRDRVSFVNNFIRLKSTSSRKRRPAARVAEQPLFGSGG